MQRLQLLLLSAHRGTEENVRFQYRLDEEGRQRRYSRYTRRALQHPSMSAFATLYGSGCDQSMITLCGLDHRALRGLLRLFEPVYTNFSPYSTSGRIRGLPVARFGRPRSMNALQCLAMYLAWTRGQGSMGWLFMVFGVTRSVADLFMRFARRILVRTLKDQAEAAIQMPTEEEIVQFKQAISERHPLLVDVYCVADGLKLRLEQSGNQMIQNAFYNGWTHDHYISNVLVFAPNGRIIACALNAPGCLHDSTIADFGDIYSKLGQAYVENGGRCVVDSAFCSSRHPFIIKSSNNPVHGQTGPVDWETSLQATSARQAAEWGMRAIQSSFPRLRDRITYEERGERRLILLSIVYLFNYRTANFGLNQLLSVYMPWLDDDARTLFDLN